MAISVPPGTITATTRSVWSTKDEAMLQELLERKRRIMDENCERLALVLQSIMMNEINISVTMHDALVDRFVKSAEELRDALLPFDGRDRV